MLWCKLKLWHSKFHNNEIEKNEIFTSMGAKYIVLVIKTTCYAQMNAHM